MAGMTIWRLESLVDHIDLVGISMGYQGVTFMFRQRGHVRVLLWVIMTLGLPISELYACAMSAPPDFAGCSLAPNDVDISVRVSGSRGAGHWAKHFEDVASDSLGANAVAEWRTLTSFLRSIVGESSGNEGPVSQLYIRFGTTEKTADWVYAAEIFNRASCERGFRDAGMVLKGGGGFHLPQGNIEVHVSGQWLIAGTSGSSLRKEVSQRAAINLESTDDTQVLEVIGEMPRSQIEILIRHQSPTGGCTAAAISEISPGIAEVLINGKYDASPLPVRPQGNIDVRLINEQNDHASIVMYESGIGIVDPLLIDIGLAIPEVLPPADVRSSLELQRLIVVEHADQENSFQSLALCLAVPFKFSNDDIEVQKAVSAINQWMSKLKRIIFPDSQHDIGTPPRDTSLPASVFDGIRKHPMVKGASLNWTISNGHSAKKWFVVGTNGDSVQRLSDRLGAVKSDESGREFSASQGVVHAQRLAKVIDSFADIRKNNADAYAQADSRIFNVLVDIASRFKDARWDFKLQGPREISGRLELSVPNSAYSSEELMPND